MPTRTGSGVTEGPALPDYATVPGRYSGGGGVSPSGRSRLPSGLRETLGDVIGSIRQLQWRIEAEELPRPAGALEFVDYSSRGRLRADQRQYRQ
jgi:hypothetical protein